MKRRKRKQSSFGSRLLISLITCGILAVLLLSFCGWAGWRVTNSDRSFPNLSLDSIRVGDMSREEIIRQIEDNSWLGLNDSELSVSFPLELSCKLDRVRAGATRTAEEAADAVLAYGRDGDWYANLWTWISTALAPGSCTLKLPEPNLNDTYIRANVKAVTDRFSALTKDAEIRLDREHAVLTLIKGGGTIYLDEDAIIKAINKALLDGSSDLEWTEISGSILLPDFGKIYDDVNVEPQPAYFDEQWNVVSEVVGCTFDTSAAEKLWREARPGTRINVPLTLNEPSVFADDLEALLYRDRLCFMTTNYWDSDADRIGNIHLAADCLNGIVLLPGEVFSYNAAVGERTEEKGYRWAGAYADGEVTTEIGGGICQVSSTLYCAAMYAQMTTTMRQNHWFPVSYLSMGYDATVSWDMPDYRFRNTRDYPVRIVSYYDEHSVTIEFWGTNTDGSHVQPWTASNELYDETWGCLIGYSVTVNRNILDANDNIINVVQEPTGIYHLHDNEIDWPPEKLAADAAAAMAP